MAGLIGFLCHSCGGEYQVPRSNANKNGIQFPCDKEFRVSLSLGMRGHGGSSNHLHYCNYFNHRDHATEWPTSQQTDCELWFRLTMIGEDKSEDHGSRESFAKRPPCRPEVAGSF